MNTTDVLSYIGLGSDVNKLDKDSLETQEGVVSDKLPELKLDMKNEELIKLTRKWEKDWKDSPKKTKWEKQIKENENYWLGKQFGGPEADSTRPMVDNLIFEALETFLPRATRRNPEPSVDLHSSELVKGQITDENSDYLEKVKDRLSDLSDDNSMRLKLKTVARHWSIFQLGVGKIGWDIDRDIPIIRPIRPKKMILDPDAVNDEDGYSGGRIGEHRTLTASVLLSIIGDGAEQGAKEAINNLVKGNKGTEVSFIEWWTPDYMCWTLGNDVLLKRRNPHWNYDKEENEEVVDIYGNSSDSTKNILGNNHFAVPKMPYVFLTMFNLGDQPMDKTGLIQQNLANQDLINKRNKQIDRNADNMNNGVVISMERSGLSEPQARNVNKALRKGGAVVIPSGSPQDAVFFPKPPSLPNDIYSQVLDTRSRLSDIFGTSGSTPAGVKGEKTVRGKIQIQSLDTDRIGGGITEYLENFSSDVYNWFLQLLYVYDEDFQFIEGRKPPKVVVSVKEGSLLPKDSLSIANQALELAGMGKISNLDLYKRLDYPNPEEMAANVWLEQNAPHVLYKNNEQVQEALGMMAQQSQVEEQGALQNKQMEAQIEIEKEQAKQQAQLESNVAEESLESIV